MKKNIRTTEKSNWPWQNSPSASAPAASLWDLAWGCDLGHKPLWILVQYSCYGRLYLGAAVMSFSNGFCVLWGVVVKMSNMSMETDQHPEYPLVH